MDADRPTGDRVAAWVTRIVNPAVVAVAALAFLRGAPDPGDARALVLAILLGPGLPTLHAVVLYRTGRQPTPFIPDGRDRIPPLMLAVLSCAACVWLLAGTAASPHLVALTAASGVTAAVSAALALRWTVSLHAAGIACPMVVGMAGVTAWYAAGIPVLALVGWARIRAGDHTVAQVVTGSLVGAGSGLAGIAIAQQLGYAV